MFYCDPCAKTKEYPLSTQVSWGKCEVCGKQGPCNDVPSKDLPAPPEPPSVAQQVADLWHANNGWIPGADRMRLSAILGIPLDRSGQGLCKEQS